MVENFAPIFCREEPLTRVYAHCATCCICIETGHRGRDDRLVTRDTGAFRIRVSVKQGLSEKPSSSSLPPEGSVFETARLL
jgi:hypothetical protein